MDHFTDLRSEMVHNLEAFGISTQLHHHEVGSGGQGEIGIVFDTLLEDRGQAHDVQVRRQEHRVARRQERDIHAQADLRDNGSGMHTHQSLWKDGEPLFFDESGYGQLSDIARWYIGGLLHHARSVLAFTNPTTNSYRRLVPGYEAPVNLVYSSPQPLGRRPDPDLRPSRAPRPSGSSSVCPTRPATPTSRSPR
jgi:glutamine synthetase